MSDQNLHFDDTSRAGLINYFEHDPTGRQISNYIYDHFAGPLQVVNHIQATPEGAAMHLINGDTFVFDNVPKRRLVSVVRSVVNYFANGGE